MKSGRARQQASGGGHGRAAVNGGTGRLDSPRTPASTSHTRPRDSAAGKSDRGDARRWAEIRPFAESLAGSKARQIIGKAGLRWSDLEDIRQQLLLYVVEHLADYDGRRGTPEAHVTMLITTAVAMLLRERRAWKRGNGRPSVSLDAVTNWERPADEYLSPANSGRRLGDDHCAEHDSMDLRIDMVEAVGMLPSQLRTLAHLLARGQTVASVARLADCSRRRVYDDVYALQCHLHRHELHDP